MITVSLWIYPDNTDTYPMVMIDRSGRKRFYYKVTTSNRLRLASIVRCCKKWKVIPSKDGWTAKRKQEI